MTRKPIGNLMKEIKKILTKNKEVSIRGLSLRTRTMWGTTEKALMLMKSLGVVKERGNDRNKRKARLFSLVKK